MNTYRIRRSLLRQMWLRALSPRAWGDILAGFCLLVIFTLACFA